MAVVVSAVLRAFQRVVVLAGLLLVTIVLASRLTCCLLSLWAQYLNHLLHATPISLDVASEPANADNYWLLSSTLTRGSLALVQLPWLLICSLLEDVVLAVRAVLLLYQTVAAQLWQIPWALTVSWLYAVVCSALSGLLYTCQYLLSGLLYVCHHLFSGMLSVSHHLAFGLLRASAAVFHDVYNAPLPTLFSRLCALTALLLNMSPTLRQRCVHLATKVYQTFRPPRTLYHHVETTRSAHTVARRRRASQTEEQLCVVCQEASKSILLLPCRHLCLCEHCHTTMVDRASWSTISCPICRNRVQKHIVVYN